MDHNGSKWIAMGQNESKWITTGRVVNYNGSQQVIMNRVAMPLNREPETVFVPQMIVPENGQSWQRVGCLLFRASRALALTRTWFSLQYRKEMRCYSIHAYALRDFATFIDLSSYKIGCIFRYLNHACILARISHILQAYKDISIFVYSNTQNINLSHSCKSRTIFVWYDSLSELGWFLSKQQQIDS